MVEIRTVRGTPEGDIIRTHKITQDEIDISEIIEELKEKTKEPKKPLTKAEKALAKRIAKKKKTSLEKVKSMPLKGFKKALTLVKTEMRRKPIRPSRREMELRFQRQQAAETLAMQQDPRFAPDIDEPWREKPIHQDPRQQEEIQRKRLSIPDIGAKRGLGRMGSNILLAFQRYSARKRAGQFTPGMEARIKVNRFNSAPSIMRKANLPPASNNLLSNTTNAPTPFFKSPINTIEKPRLNIKWL